MDSEKLIKAVENTGYGLEYEVYNILRDNGWQVISNRYYIDDVKDTEREIDLLAYKSNIDENKVIYYTVLIISCKKSKESFWCFLTHKKPKQDPNFHENIIDNYTTDKRLDYMLKTNTKTIENSLNTNKKVRELLSTTTIPFAFQQINSKSYKTEDDKRIYDSIITPIKALEYEKHIRQKPKIKNVDTYFYNYNLISIFDGDMVEVFFDNQDKEVKDISQIKYINRHIINKKEAFYKVHFINKNSLTSQIHTYDELHKSNIELYPLLLQNYYTDIFKDKYKVDIYWSNFSKEIEWIFNYTAIHVLGFKTKHRAESFSFDYENDLLTIYTDGFYDVEDEDFFTKINSDKELKVKIRKALKKYYRYEGNFIFDEEPLPF